MSRGPSPLREVLSAWDTKPATASLETQIAKGRIQAALRSAPESLDEARYIDGLTNVFNRHIEDARAVNNVR